VQIENTEEYNLNPAGKATIVAAGHRIRETFCVTG
jgi:hypothetical protein